MKPNQSDFLSSKILIFLILTVFVLISNIPASAQNIWSSKPKNLKVLPANISSDDLRATMQAFSSALGVHCNYCHDDSKGTEFKDIDFASDAKPAKKAAQIMLKMVANINGTSLKDAREFNPDIGSVKCVTCHRGSASIDMLEDVLFSTYKKDGYDATIKQYGDLRKEYYGGFTYDFRDHTLLSLASKINDAGKFDDAVKIVNKDIELFPDSATPLIFLGSTYMKKGNNDEAVKYLEKALVMDPNNRFAADMLKRLKNPEKK